jgi:hypothetical protein
MHECDFDTHECDFHTHECDFDTHECGWEMAVWERKEKKYNKKVLMREGPNSSSFPELIDNWTKNPAVSFVVI